MKARRRRNFFFLVVTIIDDSPRSGVWPGVGGTLPERSSAFKTHSVTGTPFRSEKRIRNGVPDSSGTKKALGFLLGLRGGFTKYSCFLCLWDSRASDKHYVVRDWPARTGLTVGQHN